jgi:hypothetical protein
VAIPLPTQAQGKPVLGYEMLQLPVATFSHGRPLRECTASVRPPLRSESTML